MIYGLDVEDGFFYVVSGGNLPKCFSTILVIYEPVSLDGLLEHYIMVHQIQYLLTSMKTSSIFHKHDLCDNDILLLNCTEKLGELDL